MQGVPVGPHMDAPALKHMVFPRNVLVGHDAIDRLGKVAAEGDPTPSVVVVFDNTTKDLVGHRVTEAMQAEGFTVHPYVSSGPTMKSVQETVRVGKQAGAGLYIGAGGGSVIDVAKLAAFRHGPGFISVPTSASHDGICSGRASIKDTQGSQSVEAKPPVGIVADTAVISQAPFRMLASGCADVISNLTAVLDWQLANRLKAEEYSSFAAVLAKSGADLILDNIEVIKPGIEEASWITVKSLVVSGVSMAVAGSSRPASGAEHLFSHYLDRTAPGVAMHGEQVGVGAMLMMALHGGDWKRIHDALETLGCPTTAKALGIPQKKIVQALMDCHTLRPERYTILGESGLTKEAAVKLCKKTGVF